MFTGYRNEYRERIDVFDEKNVEKRHVLGIRFTTAVIRDITNTVNGPFSSVLFHGVIRMNVNEAILFPCRRKQRREREKIVTINTSDSRETRQSVTSRGELGEE